MHFILRYNGPLKSNGNSTHKQEIREFFHPQIKKATTAFPAIEQCIKYADFWTQRDNNKYYQLINSGFCLLAELDILLLRQGSRALVQGGDIDNRLKTLLDALTIPHKGQNKKIKNEPIYCLLEDDKLISSLSVKSEPLLSGEDENSDYAEVIIKVKTKFSKVTIENISFAQL